ncbi:MAG: hypothetical protein JWN44_4457, partial [Myxococcales bacterium]|nr:hypothetical protein [Myxococcales bacterium]
IGILVAVIGVFGSIAATLAVFLIKQSTSVRIGSGLVTCVGLSPR